jgi:hypothetical protein
MSFAPTIPYEPVEFDIPTATMVLQAPKMHFQRSLRPRKLYPSFQETSSSTARIVLSEVAEELSIESVTTKVDCATPDAERRRGVFAPEHTREILFTDVTELRVAELPRWRPRVTIDRRSLARDDF